MSERKKKVEQITSMDEDFSKWYTDVVRKAGLMDYSPVRGCMIMEPYGYAVWENIRSALDRKIKESGHVNVMFPTLIPESLLQKEKDHVEGFAPEVAWVTHGGNEKLNERLCVRPTSEVLFCDYFSRAVKSWRDLPKLYNQWCSVIRWEKTARPFLRSVEFLWQEGHTLHESKIEARRETEEALKTYVEFFREYLSIPVIEGKKTDGEKFAGAEYTYTVEAMMHDGRALQSATSHYFGDGFCRAFDIKFTNKKNEEAYPYQTSWGTSTRMIAGVIMVHGDDDGLVLPPGIAPIQVVVIPIRKDKPEVNAAVEKIFSKLKNLYRVEIDDSDQSPGWKFAEYEMKGVPIRIEVGPRDVEKGNCVLVRRDTGEKIEDSIEDIELTVELYLEKIKNDLYDKALNRMKSMTYKAVTMDEFKSTAESKPGFIKATWCGDAACEKKIKETTGFTSRCVALENQPKTGDDCVVCGNKAKKLVYWGKAY